MERVQLIHWNADEASERAEHLRAFGYAVDYEPMGGSASLRELRNNPPVAIVIDQSASMAREGANGDLLDRARSTAAAIVELLDEGDQAFLVAAASPPRSILPGGTFSRTTVADAVDELEATSAATDYTGAVRLAADLLGASHNLNRELYVVGDIQRSGWTGSVRRGSAKGPESVWTQTWSLKPACTRSRSTSTPEKKVALR